jgi:hypothetical protein
MKPFDGTARVEIPSGQADRHPEASVAPAGVTQRVKCTQRRDGRVIEPRNRFCCESRRL